MTTLGPLFAALIVTLVLSRGMLRWAPKLGLLDTPTARKPHTHKMPVGGPALVFGVLVGWGLGQLLGPEGVSWAMGGWLLGALLVALIGLLDDRRELRPGVKLLGQTVAAFLPLLGGNVVYSIELGGATLPLGLLAAPFTLLWIVGVTNALNLTDGLDGLASGLSAIVALACIALSAQTGNGEALSLALALLGSTLGFLALNSPPARLFLGDGGSYFLGFLLAGLVLAAVQPRWGAFEGMPWVVPIALLGYPLADTLWAVIRRLRAGRSIFEPDDQHLHHGLWRALEDERKAVWALWGLTMLLAALALALFSVAGPGRS